MNTLGKLFLSGQYEGEDINDQERSPKQNRFEESFFQYLLKGTSVLPNIPWNFRQNYFSNQYWRNSISKLAISMLISTQLSHIHRCKGKKAEFRIKIMR